MKLLEKAADIGVKILSVISGILATFILIYSAYVLYDNFYTGQTAFASWDLQQYKPVPQTGGEAPDFRELMKINPDTAGWLTLYDTNIDYPVVQGKDDLEYAGKDVFGKSSLSGAIYLSSGNDRSFRDDYNIIYGHHMDNGAMFGDIDKYANEEFFMAHRGGELVTPEGVYKLNVFACMKTNAYESEVYSIQDKASGLDDVLGYISRRSEIYLPVSPKDVDKIVVLSTCARAETNGRIVIFCQAEKKSDSAPVVPAVAASTGGAVGHDVFGHDGTDSWGLLNVICVLITLLTVLPMTRIRQKYRQLQYSKHKAGEFRKYRSSRSRRSGRSGNEFVLSRRVVKKLRMISRDLMNYYYGMIIGLVLEVIVAGVAVYILVTKENFFAPMILSNGYTGILILIASAGLLIDFIFYRYRGILPPKKSQLDKMKTADAQLVENA